MRIFIAALLAAFLALPLAAADRPVGPETGKSLIADGGDFVKEPDWETTNPKPGVSAPNGQELGIMPLSWYERIMRQIECQYRTWC